MSVLDLGEELGFLIIKTAKFIERQLNDTLSEYGLTLAQSKIVLRLCDNDLTNQRSLSECLDVEPATIVRTLDRMERDGFIKRKKNPMDRRVHIIQLTTKAKELIPELKKSIQESFDKSLGDINEETKKSMMDYMNKITGCYEAEEVYS